jgi:hypothetical protein
MILVMAKRPRPPSQRKQARTAQAVEDLPLWPETVRRGGLVKMLAKQVEALRRGDAHGNRQLFLDDVFIAYLLAFFNPSIRSLRTIEDFSQTKQARPHLSIAKICRATLSDFQRLADPQRLAPIVAALQSELVNKSTHARLPNDLADLHRQVLAVDGTFLPAAADVAWAVASRNQRDGERHRARLDWQVDIATWLPEVVVVPDPGESEADSAARHIVDGSIGLYDRGYGSFDLIAAHYRRDAGATAFTPRAEFVIRLKQAGSNSPTFEAVAARPLDAGAIAARVVSDRIGVLPGLEKQHAPGIQVREIVITAPDGKPVRLVTNLLTVPAQIIALLYKHRWQIELFFRWLKCFANFNHLISRSREGVLLNFYVVIIGVLLMYLHTGFRPSKYALILLGSAAQGASLEEILPILRERERQCEVARLGAAKRRAKKQSESK